jgi:hypothetical protein
VHRTPPRAHTRCLDRIIATGLYKVNIGYCNDQHGAARLAADNQVPLKLVVKVWYQTHMYARIFF